MEFGYPGSKDGKLPIAQGSGMLDVVSTIAFMAAHTSRIRFGTGVALLPQRNPVYTAKEFTTLDWLSSGRIDFGVGVGWCKEEVIACGERFDNRGARCNEYLEIVRSLWTEPYTEFHGAHYDLARCRMDPKPIQQPHVPIIVGGHSRAAFTRAARYGDGWYGFGLSPRACADLLGQIDAALEQENRARESLQIVVTPPAEATPELIDAYAELGVDRLVPRLRGQRPVSVDRGLEDLAAAVAAA